jgi:hypothetical protein
MMFVPSHHGGAGVMRGCDHMLQRYAFGIFEVERPCEYPSFLTGMAGVSVTHRATFAVRFAGRGTAGVQARRWRETSPCRENDHDLQRIATGWIDEGKHDPAGGIDDKTGKGGGNRPVVRPRRCGTITP